MNIRIISCFHYQEYDSDPIGDDEHNIVQFGRDSLSGLHYQVHSGLRAIASYEWDGDTKS